MGEYKIKVPQTHFDLPEEIFGKRPHASGHLKRNVCVLTDPLCVTAEMMLDPSVVGDVCDF